MTRRKFDRFMIDVHIGTNRKLRRLTVAERWCHVAGVLAVAAQAPVRGCLVIGSEDAEPEDYAEMAGVSVGVARSTIEKLRAADIIVPDVEHLCERIHDWEDYNPAPKKDPTAAERMRRLRDRRNARNGNGAVTDRNAVTVTPGREEKGKERAKALSSSEAPPSDPKATEADQLLCRLLAEQNNARNPKAKVQAPARWLTDMRLLRERDDASPEEIERVIRWVFTDPSNDAQFWARTIQSPGNLRQHFPRMWGQITAPVLKAVPVEDSASFLSRRGAA